jgi:DNA-binding FrmR family transcriptional regulator
MTGIPNALERKAVVDAVLNLFDATRRAIVRAAAEIGKAKH